MRYIGFASLFVLLTWPSILNAYELSLFSRAKTTAPIDLQGSRDMYYAYMRRAQIARNHRDLYATDFFSRKALLAASGLQLKVLIVSEAGAAANEGVIAQTLRELMTNFNMKSECKANSPASFSLYSQAQVDFDELAFDFERHRSVPSPKNLLKLRGQIDRLPTRSNCQPLLSVDVGDQSDVGGYIEQRLHRGWSEAPGAELYIYFVESPNVSEGTQFPRTQLCDSQVACYHVVITDFLKTVGFRNQRNSASLKASFENGAVFIVTRDRLFSMIEGEKITGVVFDQRALDQRIHDTQSLKAVVQGVLNRPTAHHERRVGVISGAESPALEVVTFIRNPQVPIKNLTNQKGEFCQLVPSER